jgi:phosphohistidine phosphatase
MVLYVVQHGSCLPKSEDPEKGLSADGKSETVRIAAVAKGYAVKVSRIAHSGKKRARETAELFAEALSPPGGIEVRRGMNPLDDVSVFAQHLPLDQNLMLVGHLPFMERLVGFLVGGNAEQTVFKLQNSGIVCLDRVPHVDNPVIRWALMPSVG